MQINHVSKKHKAYVKFCNKCQGGHSVKKFQPKLAISLHSRFSPLEYGKGRVGGQSQRKRQNKLTKWLPGKAPPPHLHASFLFPLDSHCHLLATLSLLVHL